MFDMLSEMGWSILGFIVSAIIGFDCFILAMTFFANWSPFLAYACGFSGAILNFYLYWQDTSFKLKALYQDIINRNNLMNIDRISAIMSGIFLGVTTFSAYQKALIDSPLIWLHTFPSYSIWIFSGCYLLGSIALYSPDMNTAPTLKKAETFHSSWYILTIATLATGAFFIQDFLSVVMPVIAHKSELKAMTLICLTLPIFLNLNSEYQYANSLSEWVNTPVKKKKGLTFLKIATFALIFFNSITNGWLTVETLIGLTTQQLYIGFIAVLFLCCLGATYLKNEPGIRTLNIFLLSSFVLTMTFWVSPYTTSLMIKSALILSGGYLSACTMYRSIFTDVSNPLGLSNPLGADKITTAKNDKIYGYTVDEYDLQLATTYKQ